MTINENAGARRKLRKECRTSRRSASHMGEGPPSVELFDGGAEDAVPRGSAHCQIDCLTRFTLLNSSEHSLWQPPLRFRRTGRATANAASECGSRPSRIPP